MTDPNAPAVLALYALLSDANAAITAAMNAREWIVAARWTESAAKVSAEILTLRHGRAEETR